MLQEEIFYCLHVNLNMPSNEVKLFHGHDKFYAWIAFFVKDSKTEKTFFVNTPSSYKESSMKFFTSTLTEIQLFEIKPREM